MKVSLSWSGARSKAAALALHDLLPSILQPISCRMSEESIPLVPPEYVRGVIGMWWIRTEGFQDLTLTPERRLGRRG